MRMSRRAATFNRPARVWALAMVLTALAGVLLSPRDAPADVCYPCGGNECIDPNSGACGVTVGGTVCVHGSLYRCWLSNGCPALVLSGQC